MTAPAIIDLDHFEPITRREAVDIGQAMYGRFADLLASIDDEAWTRQTDCSLWTVRDLVGHVVGMMHTSHGLRRLIVEQARVARRARRTGEEPVDAMTAMQAESVAELAPGELVETMRSRIEGASRGRRKVPPLVARTLRFPQVVNDSKEKWTLDYLLGIIITRDTWLHRVADVSRAVGVDPVLDELDQRLVADVAAEWVRRHAQPVTLTLTGPAGGMFQFGTMGPRVEADAVEFCRMLSGRAAPSHDLLATQVPF